MSLNIKETKTAELNQYTFDDYYSRLRGLAISSFEWQGLPNEISRRFLETTLFDHGRIAFIHDSELGYMVVKCVPSGALNHYGEPVGYTLQALGGFYREVTADEIVLIRNNYQMIPTDYSIRLFAMRLYEVERTIDTNIKQMKTPLIVRVDDKLRLTLLNLYRQYDGNQPFILADKDLPLDLIKSVDTKAPYLADKLTDYKHNIWNEALTYLGLNNNATENKRERMLTDEVNANNQVIEMSAAVMLLCRIEAAEEINRKFGLNVSVKPRVEMKVDQGGSDNGEVHGRIEKAD